MKTRTAINTLENRKAIKKLMKPKVGSLGKKKSTKLIGLQLTDQEKKREKTQIIKPGMKAETSQLTLQKQK